MAEPKDPLGEQSLYLSPAQYLAQRVEHQLNWYGKRSAYNKRWYYRLQFITLLAAAAVPVISLSSGDIRVRFLVAILGAIAATAAGVLSMYQFRDQWLDYRSTAESLKFEKHLFLTRSAPYATQDAFSRFVQRVESIIISENRSWQEKTFDVPRNESDEVMVETADLQAVAPPDPDQSETSLQEST